METKRQTETPRHPNQDNSDEDAPKMTNDYSGLEGISDHAPVHFLISFHKLLALRSRHKS